MDSIKSHPYCGKRALLTSKHQKLKLFQETFMDHLNLTLDELPLDTDILGTFSGEIERTATPLHTAIKKAELGLDATGLTLGMASEGSIGSDPHIPWIQCDYELAVFLDRERELVISESYKSNEIVAATITARRGDDLSSFLEKADFPHHGLIVRTFSREQSQFRKGIHDISTLREAIESLAELSPTHQVVIESDFRAMHSPSRQRNISAAASRLALRIAAQCPQCTTPGWGIIDYLKGVECRECGDVNPDAISVEILGCYRCDFTAPGNVIRTVLEAAQCTFCNP
ncbi:MAG: DUF6671 family protein [Candidatus Planktophila sp.]